MDEAVRPSLAEFVRYLPQVRDLNLTDAELRAIPVHPVPPSDQVFLSLGELPPSAPPLEPSKFPIVGTRQIYAYQSDMPPDLWNRLTLGIGPHRTSGAVGTSMFGNQEERVVDEDNPALSWRVLDAGQSYHPPAL